MYAEKKYFSQVNIGLPMMNLEALLVGLLCRVSDDALSAFSRIVSKQNSSA
jgi:hypothetical protein